jgi:hypothetical protein
MQQAEKRRLSARWCGEASREISILIVVFVPLDWFLRRQDEKLSATAGALTAAIVIFGYGVKVGYQGERRREHDGEPDVE